MSNKIPLQKPCVIPEKSIHAYYVCSWADWDKNKPYSFAYSLGEPEGPMYGWCEPEEVANHYRAEEDGLLYYIGDKDMIRIEPSYEEVKEILEELVKEPDRINSQAEIKAVHIFMTLPREEKK